MYFFFLFFIFSGTVREDLLHPDWKEFIIRSLSLYVDRKIFPEHVRIGSIIADSDSAEAGIRLLGKNRIPGRVFLEKHEGVWFITDLHADFASAEYNYKSEEEKFEPGIYNWLEENL